jgi:hypothetical protein
VTIEKQPTTITNHNQIELVESKQNPN